MIYAFFDFFAKALFLILVVMPSLMPSIIDSGKLAINAQINEWLQ